MVEIKLPCHGICVKLESTDTKCGGVITSDLHEDDDGPELKVALDVLESFVLAAACAGVDIEALEFVEAIETTVEAVFQNHGAD